MVARNRRVLACGAALSALAFAGGAMAQAAPAQTEVEEIVVTAQRRSESLQDVPVTVTAFGAEQIEEAKIRQIDDVSTRTPGLEFDAFPASQPRIVIRGIGSFDRGAAGDPSSAVFLDEIYLGRPAMVAFDAFDVERIEVLKGPQGTLFGRNVVGGAVNVVSARPKLGAFDAGVEATVGNFERFEGAGFLNAPLGDSAAVRASASWRSHAGYVDNSFTGGELDDQETLSGRLQLAAEVSETFRVQVALDGTRDRGAGPGQHVFDLDLGDPLSGFWTIDRDPEHSAGSIDGFQDRDTWGLRVQADWDLPFATLTYLGSYRDLDYAAFYDFDGGNGTTNFIGISGGNAEQSTASSHELRLNSLPDSPIQWVAGVYNYSSDTQRLDVLVLDIGGAGTEIFSQDAQLNSWAAYGDVTVPVSDTVSLIGGLRYSKDEKDYRVSDTEGDSIFRAGELFDVASSASFDAVTWRIGANYQPDDDNLFYVMISRGFKSGGFQDTPATAAEAADTFDPEFATQYEIGAKSTLLGGALIWNNTLYWMDYTDLQTRRTLPGGASVTDNAGAATIKGYETYFSWRPFEGAKLVASYGYTDAKFDDFQPEPGVDWSGNQISRVPEHKVVLSPSYDWALAGGGEVRFAADFRYESMIWDDNSNSGPERRPATRFWDGRIVYTEPQERWSVSLWGKNLTDQYTRTFQATFLGANFGAYSPPRTYGLTFNWKY